jgi:hypothetical protein
MVFSVRPAAVVCLGLLFAAPFVCAQSHPEAARVVQLPPLPLLPPSFGTWSAASAPVKGNDPGVADPANGSILKEYGLKDFATAEYTHGAGKLSIKAMRFVDATGAYGAFTFYRRAEMHPADIGKEAALDAGEALIWSGTTFVDATSQHIGPEERAALQALAAALPKNAGPEGVAPSLPERLPAQSLQKSTVRYAIGPDAYVKAGGVLPPELIDFGRDAEAVTAKYSLHSGQGTLTILEYPTPQIAGDRDKAIEAILKSGALPAGLQGSSASALGVRRNGALVAVTSGAISAEDSAKLLDRVKDGVALTWNHPEGYVSEVGKTAHLLLGIMYLTAILGCSALLLGIFLGGGRALVRVMRGKPPSTLNDDDFISLKLGR